MINLPRASEIRFGKLIIHFVLLVAILTILTRFGENLVGLALGHPIETNTNYVSSAITATWILFAIQSSNYQKHKTNNHKG